MKDNPYSEFSEDLDFLNLAKSKFHEELYFDDKELIEMNLDEVLDFPIPDWTYKETNLPEALGVPTWTYKDLPNLSLKLFNEFNDMIGLKNIMYVTLAQRTWSDGTTTYRGQVLISPEGIKNMNAFLA